MSDELILLPTDAPAPLEIYEAEKIHPDNLKLLQERLDRYRILTRRERKELEGEQKRLRKQLNKAGYNDLCWRREDTHLDYQKAKTAYVKLLQAQSTVKHWMLDGIWSEANWIKLTVLYDLNRGKLADLRIEGRKLSNRLNLIDRALLDLNPLHDQYQEITSRLEQDERMFEEDREQEQTAKKFFKEADIIEQLMKDTFRRTTGCHHIGTDNRGRYYTEIPYFRLSGSNADSHWFLLACSEQTRMGGWIDVLPYGVDVDTLISDRVLNNLSAAVGFQVEVRRAEDNRQIYYYVHRLDSPNGLPAYITFETLFALYPSEERDFAPFPVGVFENRRVKYYNLKTHPHILVGGQSRQGKSNFLNDLISTWIQTQSPEELRLILIDNKRGVEFVHYEGIPHLMGEFVQSLEEVFPRLKEVHRLMDARLSKLRNAKQKDIYAYNDHLEGDEPRMPHLVVVIDEMSTLLNQGQLTRDIHHQLTVIGSQGAAAGVHLVICTQHPSKEVVPMPIKTNMSLIVAFHMSAYASQTILAHPAAAELPRKLKGRVKIGSGAELDEAQTAFISDEAIAQAVRYAIKTWGDIQPELVIPKVKERPLIPFADGEPISDVVLELPAAVPELETVAVATAATVKIVPFDEADLIALALDKFNGDLKARPIYEAIKHEKVATSRRVKELVDRIVERGRCEYQGIQYRTVLRPGNFHTLLMLTAQMDGKLIPHIPFDSDAQLTDTQDLAQETSLEGVSVGDVQPPDYERLLAAGD